MRYVVLVFSLLLLPAIVSAHPGHDHGGFGAGFAHPMMGFDHLLAMLGVGFWAAQQRSLVALVAIPAAFLAAMMLGFALGLSSSAMPAVELGIAGSLLVIGMLVFAGRRLPLLLAAPVAGVFALLHGHAHGAEMVTDLSALAFGAGFSLAALLLMTTGVALGYMSNSFAWARPAGRVAGGLLMAASLYLLVVA